MTPPAMQSLIDALYLASSAEREAANLLPLDTALMIKAVTTIADMRAAIVDDPSLARIGLEPLEALDCILDDILSFRRQKIIGQSTCPVNANPAEREFFANMARANAILKQSWPSVMHPLPKHD